MAVSACKEEFAVQADCMWKSSACGKEIVVQADSASEIVSLYEENCRTSWLREKIVSL